MQPDSPSGRRRTRQSELQAELAVQGSALTQQLETLQACLTGLNELAVDDLVEHELGTDSSHRPVQLESELRITTEKLALWRAKYRRLQQRLREHLDNLRHGRPTALSPSRSSLSPTSGRVAGSPSSSSPSQSRAVVDLSRALEEAEAQVTHHSELTEHLQRDLRVQRERNAQLREELAEAREQVQSMLSQSERIRSEKGAVSERGEAAVSVISRGSRA